MDENQANSRPEEKQTGIKPWIPLILAIIYAVSPIDIIPDFIPVAGWAEDALFMVVGGLSGIQNGILGTNSFLGKITKYLKWIILILGVLVIVIIVLIALLIYKLAVK